MNENRSTTNSRASKAKSTKTTSVKSTAKASSASNSSSSTGSTEKKKVNESENFDKTKLPDMHAMFLNESENKNKNLGTVWLYNGTDQDLKISINKGADITLERSPITPKEGMIQGGLPIKRSPSNRECRFGELNTMRVCSGGQTSEFTDITIPNRIIALNKNLQMYIFYTAAVLSFDGKVLWAASLENEVDQ